MPPSIPRKRLRSPSPEAGPSRPPARRAPKPASSTPRKATLFDDLDVGTSRRRTSVHTKAVLDKLAATDEESSLSSLSSDEFEDIPGAKRQKTADISDDEDEDIEFEDVDAYTAPVSAVPVSAGDLELTLTKDTRVSMANPLGVKRGPSKIERQIRISTHQVHVQLLMFHNAIRNAWLCSKELHAILLKQLSPGIEQEVQRWRRDSGLQPREEDTPKGKGKAKAKNAKGKHLDPRSQRDWGNPAERLAAGEVNMSRGDPLIRLLSILINYWRQRFRVTAPSLRKLGYMSLQRLDEEIKSFENDGYDPERHGERIRDIEEFKQRARALDGSRDVGAQLFTALLRAIGLEARMVANLQPAGFGWSQNEEASEKNPRKLKKPKASNQDELSSGSDEESAVGEEEIPQPPRAQKANRNLPKSKTPAKVSPISHPKSLRSNRSAPIDLSSSELSSAESDEESVIDVTPATKRSLPSLPYDRDLCTPNYWTEVLSPVAQTYTPIDPVVLHLQANKPELYEKFLPPPKSEKVKHVTSYVIGYSPDGTAKDVTTRYLKGRMWPGRTKGYRLPPEKISVLDRRGKVKRYETHDWFKRVMTGYVRGTKQCPRAETDDHEEATVLKPVKREKKVAEEGKETLQYYKTSTEFVLERHLKREEALIPTAIHAKMFTVKGKGDQTTEEKVFLRKDVVLCKSMETWHKEGRAPIPGEEPLKRVPYRAATTNRRRELAEAEHASGQKVLQGLYSRDQTDWIIPPPIENGIIPKNSFGNIDLYVDSMLPEGAVHIPMRGTVKICKRLGIDYAEAVTGFEFGHRMAVPIITGVVIAEEHYNKLMDEWQKDEMERVRKEDEKRRKAVLNMWRRMLMGRRIVERVREEYGDSAEHAVDALNPWTNKKKTDENISVEAQRRVMAQREEDNAGGFFPEGHDEEESDMHHAASFFPVAHEDEGDRAGGFVVEGHDDEPSNTVVGQAYPTPQSLESNPKPVPTDDEDEDGEQQTSEPELKVAARKPRKPAISKAPITPSSTSRTPSKRSAAQKKPPTSMRRGRRKVEINDTEDDESPLSEVESESRGDDSEDEALPASSHSKGVRKKHIARASTTNIVTPRSVPKRTAARRSSRALRSHYFENADDDDDDGG